MGQRGPCPVGGRGLFAAGSCVCGGVQVTHEGRFKDSPSNRSLSSRLASRLSLLSWRSISWLIRFCSLASSDRQHAMIQGSGILLDGRRVYEGVGSDRVGRPSATASGHSWSSTSSSSSRSLRLVLSCQCEKHQFFITPSCRRFAGSTATDLKTRRSCNSWFLFDSLGYFTQFDLVKF